MQDNKQASTGRKVPAVWTAGKLIAELAHDPSHVAMMMGVTMFEAVEAEEPHCGGVRFTYAGWLCRNQSREVKILAMPDGTRRMEWYTWTARDQSDSRLVDEADGIKPEDMEKVWYGHTDCPIRIPWEVESCAAKFKTGRTVATPAALDAFTQRDMCICLKRHCKGDWGDVCEADRQSNEEALNPECPARIMSVYKQLDGRTLWIITEADRSATTVLLPEDY